jgi:hypothetical protein
LYDNWQIDHFPTNGLWDECEPDSDGDGIDDNCPTIANAGQADCDLDGLGDVCDFINDDPGLFFPIALETAGPPSSS